MAWYRSGSGIVAVHIKRRLMMRQTYQKDKIIGRGCDRDYYLKVKKTIKENVSVRAVPLLLLSLFLMALAFTGVAVQEAVADDGSKLKVQESYGKLPFYPFEGKTQMDGRVRYFEKGIGHTTYFAKDDVHQSFIQGIKPEIRSRRLSPPPVFAGPHASAEAGAKPFTNGNIHPPYPDKTSKLRYGHEFDISAGFNRYSGQKLDLITQRGTATPENNIIFDSEVGSISGRVTDSGGAGIQNVWVYVYDTNWVWISSASTDANGNYTVMGIPTGSYKVEFSGSYVGYVNEWYNNKPDFGNADFVSVTAPNTTAGIDAVLSVKTWFEENDPAITYTGTWNFLACNPCNNGILKYSGQTGAKAEFSFYGTGIKWHTAKAPSLGKAKISFNGVYKGMVDLYSPVVKYPLVLGGSGLPPGNYTLTIEVSGQKNRRSTGYHTLIDAFEVIP
ncbi:MAG TPA: carboxypeptidase-like regulatory domain-containing protein [Nitrospirota bacterium]|nr:carboxypeptidase-like regulatory domain-containing protein [Nitrospirota bacterium]